MATDSQKQFELDINEYDAADVDRITIKKIRSGDIMACNDLVKKYENLEKILVPGGNQDDLRQEGLVGVYHAIKSFDLSKDIPFSAFARTCIDRRLKTAIKNSTRQKHIPLNSSISLTQETFDDGENTREVMDVIDSEVPDPADTIVSKEMFMQICSEMKNVLSPLEKDVFKYRLDGYSYEQMAKQLGTSEKAIDNALQRIKGKVMKFRNGNDEREI